MTMMKLNLSTLLVVLLARVGSVSATCYGNVGDQWGAPYDGNWCTTTYGAGWKELEGRKCYNNDRDCKCKVDYHDVSDEKCVHCPGNDDAPAWCEATYGDGWKEVWDHDCYNDRNDCMCKDGYHLEDTKCVTDCPGNDDPPAWCQETYGAGWKEVGGQSCYNEPHDCTCKDGYHLQGIKCVTECPGNDDPPAWCQETYGAGWKEVGEQSCYNEPHDCTCKDGYHDVGDTKCQHCPGNNSPLAWCKETYGAGYKAKSDRDCYNDHDDCQCEGICDPGSFGDPHFRTWGDIEEFDFHGECDLVLLHSEALDMSIHVRSTIRFDYSFLSHAVVRIGEDRFEVASFAEYMLNDINSIDMPARMGDYFITMEEVNKKKSIFTIHLDGDMEIKILTMKAYISVSIANGKADFFKDTVGLMGDPTTGEISNRDGSVLQMNVEQANDIGQEWQVQPEVDGQLFSYARYPQFPAKCELPPAWAIPTLKGNKARGLGEALISQEDAEDACSQVAEHQRANCIKDVVKTQDRELAEVY